MAPTAALLACGRRLHLQHGPIDLLIDAEGEEGARRTALEAAILRFETVLSELVTELSLLRAPLHADAPLPEGEIARRMHRAACIHAAGAFITPMAAVAGAVADTILEAMLDAAPLARAYVNNGGDIAVHLTGGTGFTSAMRRHDGRVLGRIEIAHGQGIGGIATSGRHGRSLSFGIADSVTVLARTAADADAAATLIANAVDLPDHPAIQRVPASERDPDSDLGERLVVTGCDALSAAEIARALDAGLRLAETTTRAGRIEDAALFLGNDARLLGEHFTRHQGLQSRLLAPGIHAGGRQGHQWKDGLR